MHMFKSNIIRYSKIGEWAANFGLVVYAAAIVFGLGIFLGVLDAKPDHQLFGIYIGDILADLTIGQVIYIFMITAVPVLLKLGLIIVIRQLFIGFRELGVFIDVSARRQILLGWILLLITPAEMISHTLRRFLLGRWSGGGKNQMEIFIDDTQIYTIIIGLVFIVIGYISIEAVKLSDENKSFI